MTTNAKADHVGPPTAGGDRPARLAVTPAQARVLVLERIPSALSSEFVPVGSPLVGRVAAADVIAAESIPCFAKSAMDGYAVRALDTSNAPVDLRVVATTLAGQSPAAALGCGEAVRIMTGAAVPPGSDAVVPVERATMRSGQRVTVEVPAHPREHIRWPAGDMRVGATVVTVGTQLTAGHVGVLSTLGITEIEVYRRPRVGVLSTGGDLIEGSAPLLPGQVRDSNRPTLLALVAGIGGEAVDLGRVPDEHAAIASAILCGVSTCDAVLTSGGVSIGDFDLVKDVLDSITEMQWMRIAVKPAKPFAFGVIEGTPIFALPGSPVASMVSFELFARPGLRRLGGHPDTSLDRPQVPAIAPDGLVRARDGKVHYVRVVVSAGTDALEARSAGGHGSYQLIALAAANALAVLPDGDGVRPGQRVDVLLLDDVR